METATIWNDALDRPAITRGQNCVDLTCPDPEQGLVDWLLSCPDKGFFVPIESESTDTFEPT